MDTKPFTVKPCTLAEMVGRLGSSGIVPIWPLWPSAGLPTWQLQPPRAIFTHCFFLFQPQKSSSSTPPHSIGQNSHKYAEIQRMRAQTPPIYVRHAPNLQEASSSVPESCSLCFPGTEKNPRQPTLCLTLGGFS